MKLTTDYVPMWVHISQAHRAAADDTLGDVKAHQARRTGKLADSAHLVESGTNTGDRLRLSIVSGVVYADAVERGANAREKASVKKGTKARTTGSKKKGTYQVMAGPLLNRASRRGPHMKANNVVRDNGPRFLEHMSARLKAGRL